MRSVFLVHALSVWIATISATDSYNMDHLKTLSEPTVIRLDNATMLLNSYFNNKSTVIVIKLDKSTIIHSSLFDTITRYSGSPFQILREASLELQQIWYQVQSDEVVQFLGPKRPLTSCLNLKNGEGGAISVSFTKTFANFLTVDLAYAYGFNNYLGAGISYKGTTSGGFTISGTYSCKVGQNSTGQIFIQPYYIEHKSPRLRQIEAVESMIWYNPFVSRVSQLRYNQWEKIENVKMVSSESRPIITCTTDENSLACDEELEGSSWVI